MNDINVVLQREVAVHKFIIGFLFVCLISPNLFARQQTVPQDSAQTAQTESQPETTTAQTTTDSIHQTQPILKFLEDNVPWIVAIFGFLFGVYQYLLRRKNKKDEKTAGLEAQAEFAQKQKEEQAQTAESQYIHTLKHELGTVKILGSADIESIPVHLLDTFVPLDISPTWRGEDRFKPGKIHAPEIEERNLSQENILQRAFRDFKVLLLVGDPGSGKTTLMKYFAITALRHGGSKKLGFTKPVLPLFLSFRDLEPTNGRPDALHKNLARWAEKHSLEVSAREFYDWLHNRETLVLLDGLDEISDVKQRQEVCDWIDKTSAAIKPARFVVTSRWTGYRKADGIELGCDHMRADLRDFSPAQQQEFLTKWFRAVYRRDAAGESEPTKIWLATQNKLADAKAAAIINYLADEKNKGLQQMAAVPMLLQIMAILWKSRDILPESRTELYNASLSYLLDFRDRRRKLEPLLPAEKARRVLAPAALWMQDTLHKDEAPKPKLHAQMQKTLDTMDKSPAAEAFCKNLVDRAGLIADYGEAEYVFRHKSFREYLAGLQLAKEPDQEKWINKLVLHFGDDWWEEPLRFFMNEADETTFDEFMKIFFASEVSRNLDQNAQNLLQTLVQEAPQKKTDALDKSLLSDKTSAEQRLTILECLKNVGYKASENILKKYLESYSVTAGIQEHDNMAYALEIIESYPDDIKEDLKSIRSKVTDLLQVQGNESFQNKHELNAEYILIPGGEFKYSVSKRIEKVPDLYFAKYPVTNKLYRRFIAYLAQQEKPLLEVLPHDDFVQALNRFAASNKDFEKYLKKDKLENILRSSYDSDKRFNEDDQPVVGVSWYAARAYCLWLSCLQAPSKINNIEQLAKIYRLPEEPEWEWAAAGREKDGSLREYPWLKKYGKPTKDLANYAGNVGKTTPMGRYPKGATPEGLYDMAGNVWEWMENKYSENQSGRALRGGSWFFTEVNMRCAARNNNNPFNRDNDYGFRVVSASPVFETL